VQVLEVETILVCGHSNCGGCAAMHRAPEELAHIPHVRKWLEISREVPGRVAALAQDGSPGEREWLTEQVNIVLQMRNLLTFPYIREKVEAGALRILGWHYLIETGEVYNFNDETGRFEPIQG
jgi:carbonic anhydrase